MTSTGAMQNDIHWSYAKLHPLELCKMTSIGAMQNYMEMFANIRKHKFALITTFALITASPQGVSPAVGYWGQSKRLD